MDVTIQVDIVSFVLGVTETNVLILNISHSVESIFPTWIVIPSMIKFIKNCINVNGPNKGMLSLIN
jgi:hypothetical protein